MKNLSIVKNFFYLCDKFRCEFFRNNKYFNNRALWKIHLNLA